MPTNDKLTLAEELASLVGRRFSYRPWQSTDWISGYKIREVGGALGLPALVIRDPQIRRRITIPWPVFKQLERAGQITWESRPVRSASTRLTEIELPPAEPAAVKDHTDAEVSFSLGQWGWL